jgi:hypothetical protein
VRTFLDFRVLNGLDDQSCIGVRGVLEGRVNAVDDRSFSEIWVHAEELGELILLRSNVKSSAK